MGSTPSRPPHRIDVFRPEDVADQLSTSSSDGIRMTPPPHAQPARRPLPSCESRRGHSVWLPRRVRSLDEPVPRRACPSASSSLGEPVPRRACPRRARPSASPSLGEPVPRRVRSISASGSSASARCVFSVSRLSFRPSTRSALAIDGKRCLPCAHAT